MLPSPWVLTLIVSVSGIVGIILLYYSVSLGRMNSAQLERVLRLSSEQDEFHGIPIRYIALSIHIAAMIFQVIFFVSFFLYLVPHGGTARNVLVVVGVAVLFELTGRMYLPGAFPLRRRQHFSKTEDILFVLCGYVFFPVSYVMQLLVSQTVKILYPKTEEERITDAEDTIKSIIDAGEKDGIFKEDDGELLQSIVEFSETIVREVMTPRIDLKCIEINQSLNDFIQMVIESGYSKIPVYRERIDEISGVLYAKDVLQFWNEPRGSVNLERIARNPYFIPETKKVQDLLREFQKEKLHLAIVVDEYGGVAGLVTIEDLLEEIVGEIHDEYDVEQEMIRQQGENVWLIDARIDLDELEDLLDFEFPQNNYETLGGFIFDQMGRIPAKGESLQFRNLDFVIEDANERRISKVKITKTTIESDMQENEKEDEDD